MQGAATNRAKRIKHRERVGMLRRYFFWPIFVTVAGLVLSFFLGMRMGAGLSSAFSFLMVAAVLSVLEISLSFDNAIVNANRLKDMTPVWQRRFLTWGILIAVFGMRLVFPLAIVAIAANVGPWSALVLALAEPETYAEIMHESHLPIAAFGGTFLMMVALTFFVDEGKDVHWIGQLEKVLCRFASIRGLEIGMVLIIIMIFVHLLPDGEAARFLYAAIFGLVVFLAVDMLSNVLESEAATETAARGGLGAFLYLEVLDASFSFDGVIGAFALTQNLLLIMIGLGIGAMYVRSMTVMLVEKQTLAEFRYLEHGAFYSILALSVIMFTQSLVHVPELITGLVGAGLIGISLWSSIRYNRRRDAAGA